MTSTYREIKFRFFSNPDEKMYALTLLGLNWGFEDDPPVYEGKIVWDGREGTRVQKYSDGHLMQFTGLKDKNGKDIYEGDIVKHNEVIEPFRVVCNEGCFEASNTHISTTVRGLYKEIEVIGNLYENPELIGGY